MSSLLPVLAAGLIMVMSVAELPALPPAGSRIYNQATASFSWNGMVHQVTSSRVSTEVLGLYSFEIHPSGPAGNPAHQIRVAPGGTAYAPYAVTNTGNIIDRYRLTLPQLEESDFTPVEKFIYLDRNADTVLDPGEAVPLGGDTPRVQPGESIHLLVRVDVQPTARSGDTVCLDLQGTSAGDPLLPADTGNVMRLTVTDRAAMRLHKRPSVPTSKPGGIVTYTMDAVNIGGGPAYGRSFAVDGIDRTGILVQAEIPAGDRGGTSYLSGSLDGVPVAQTPVFSTDRGGSWSESEPAEPAEITNVGYLIEREIVPDQAIRLEFEVRVASGHGEGTLHSEGELVYAGIEDGPELVARAEARVKVAVPDKQLAVFIGPEDDPRAAVDNDTNAGYTIAPGLGPGCEDKNLPANAEAAGNWVVFANTVENASRKADTVNIEIDSLRSNLPADWTVMLTHADGTTPLTDSSGDGIRDLGVLGPGETHTINTRIYVPPTAESGDNRGAGFQTVIRASMASAPQVADRTVNIIKNVIQPAKVWSPLVKCQQVDEQPQPGDKITYTLSFGNRGDTVLTNVVIIDELDAGLVDVRGLTQGQIRDLGGSGRTVTATGRYDPAEPRKVIWNIPELPPGFLGRVFFTADFADTLQSGTKVFNDFVIRSDQTQHPSPSNTVSATVEVPTALALEKQAGASTAVIGDLILYTLNLSNSGGNDLNEVEVIDTLPPGFRYDRDSATFDGKALEPAVSADGRTLTWQLDRLPAGTSGEINYACFTTADAISGDGRNTALVTGKLPFGRPVSASAFHQIELAEGRFANRSSIFGKVFLDQNHNRVQDAGEPGIGGVRLYLEDGAYVETDREGKFHFAGIKPGMRVVRLDQATLDPKLIPAVIDSGQAGNPWSHFVDLKYGTPHKANFRVILSEPREKPRPAAAGRGQRPGRMGPIEVTERGATSILTVGAEKPLEIITFHDRNSGIVNLQFLETAPGREEPPVRRGWPENPHIEELRIYDDPVGRQTKIQVRLQQQNIGFPPVEIQRQADEIMVLIGAEAGHRCSLSSGTLGIGEDGEKRPDPPAVARAADDDGPPDRIKPRFISPADGTAFVSRSRINVRTACHLAAAFELYVNDEKVDKSQIGDTRYRVGERRVEYEYVAVALEPGPNRLRFSARAPGQEEEEHEEITVYRSAAPRSIRIDVFPEQPAADGRTEPVLAVRLLDGSGIPTASGSVVTVLTDGGEIRSRDLRPMEAGHQVQVRDGVAHVRLSSADQPETRVITVHAGDLTTRTRVRYRPELRDWFVSGIASVTGSYQEAKDEFGGQPVRRGFEAGDRIAFFAKGRLPFEVLMTASYDSAGETDNRKILQPHDPLQYYPVYGDESEPKHEAESGDKLFLKLERHDSRLMWGDFYTSLDRSRLTAYDRSFTGGRSDLKLDWFSLDGFFARHDQAQVKAELPGRGISGYYQLPDRNLIVNSERISIEIRDRFHPERVVGAVTKRRYADYDLDYDHGRVLFTQPVPSVDRNFNPVVIVARYEVDGRRARKYNVYGGRAAIHDPDRRFELGITRVVEQSRPRDYTLDGVDAAVELRPGLKLKGEYAQTGTIEGDRDQAQWLELVSDRDRARFRAWYEDVGKDFENLSLRGTAAGLETFGLEGEFEATARLRFRDRLYSRRNRTAGTVSEVLLHDNIYTVNRLELLLGGGYVRETENRSSRTGNRRCSSIARTGLGLDLGRRWRLETLHQQAFADTTFEQPTRTQGDLSFKYDHLTRFYLAAERRESVSGGAGHNLALGAERQISRNLKGFQELTMDRAADGRRLASGTGLELRFPVTPEWTLGAVGEVSRTVSGDTKAGPGQEDFRALSLGAFYRSIDSVYTAVSRYEIHDSNLAVSHLAEVGGTVRVNPDHTWFGRNIVTYSDQKTDQNRHRWSFDLRTGWAYRPVVNDRLMILADVEIKTDSGTGAADRNRLQRYLFNGELHYQPMARTWLEAKYGARIVEADYTSTVLFSDVKALRLQYDLSDRFYGAGGLRVLSVYAGASHALSYGLELGYNLRPDVRLAGGYNFRGFKDYDFVRNDKWQKGFYVALFWKFDASILGVLNRLEGNP